mgnify:CR=1 FL=1
MKICNDAFNAETPELASIFQRWPFVLSDFQKFAIDGILNGKHVIITAHTGNGKTLPADFAISHFTRLGKKVIYTSPIKALTNQKCNRFSEKYPDIEFGIITGDTTMNPGAQCLFVTTEILRNTLFKKKWLDANEDKKEQITLDIDINPEELEKIFYFGDIRFKWDFDKKAYVSYGDIGIANIKKKQVMRYVKGKVVIFKRITGDEITVYLEPEDDAYYFFNYKRGLMQVFSSDEEFNTIILETKKDNTKFKGGKEEEDFQFMMGSKTFVTAFRRSFFE